MRKQLCTTKGCQSSIMTTTRGRYEPKNPEGAEEGQPNGQENEAEEEDESREGRSIMR